MVETVRDVRRVRRKKARSVAGRSVPHFASLTMAFGMVKCGTFCPKSRMNPRFLYGT